MGVLIVQVDEGPLHLGQVLQALLKTLADVVGDPQAHVLGKHDVHLHQEVVAEVEGAHGVDVADVAVVVHGRPRQLGQEVRSGRVAC